MLLRHDWFRFGSGHACHAADKQDLTCNLQQQLQQLWLHERELQRWCYTDLATEPLLSKPSQTPGGLSDCWPAGTKAPQHQWLWCWLLLLLLPGPVLALLLLLQLECFQDKEPLQLCCLTTIRSASCFGCC